MPEPSEKPPADPAMDRYRLLFAQKRQFAKEIEPLRPAFHRYCRSLTDSVWDAEDLVQDSLLRAFAVLGEVHVGVRDMRAYLWRTATNLWIDGERRRAPLVMSHDEMPEDAAPAAPSRPEVGEALAELARRLPPQERVAVLLKDVFEFPLADVARALGTTDGAVKAALHRGRARLGDAPRPASTSPRRAASTRLADEFAAAFSAKDVARLVALMAPGGTTDILGVVRELPEGIDDGSFVHTLRDERLLRGERRELLGETVVVLWYSVEEDGRRFEAVRDAMRFEEAGGRCRRMVSYYFCPETLAEIGRALGAPARGNGYVY